MSVYYFDITDTLDHLAAGGGITGIQRVVISMMEATHARLGGQHVRALVFRPGSAVPEAFDPGALAVDGRSIGEGLIHRFRGSGDRPQMLADWLLRRYATNRMRRLYHGTRLRLAHAAGFGSLRRRNLTLKASRDPFDGISLVPAALAAGDTVLALGALWAGLGKYGASRREQGLRAARAAGARIALMVHDLIPHLFPEFVPRPHDRNFVEMLGRAVDRADLLLANSAATARDLDAFLLAREGSRPPIRVVRLTQSFPAPRTRQDDLRRQVTRHIAADAALPFVLTVGSVDVRKNFPALARVWRALGDEIGPSMPRLIIAGRRGWNSHPFLDQLKQTGGFGGLVQLVEDATDLDLEYLYGRCLFTVLPSLYEGWGLPIGESLWFGKLCIASNTSSMPEVGGDLADYFDPRDLDAMAAAIRRPIVDPAYREAREREIATAKLRDWSAAASDLVDAVEAPMNIREDSATTSNLSIAHPKPAGDLRSRKPAPELGERTLRQ